MSMPYIGAKISLTSRSLIRYEGILASVDTRDATITLEQVRMMGTEGRVPNKDIPASNDVYDMVVFRSEEIEDLQIFEPPAPAPEPAPVSKPFVDPAVLSTKAPENSSSISAGGWPAAPRLQFGTATGPIAPSRAAPALLTSSAISPPSAGSIRPPTFIQWGEAPQSTPARPPTFGSLSENVRPRAPASFNVVTAPKASLNSSIVPTFSSLPPASSSMTSKAPLNSEASSSKSFPSQPPKDGNKVMAYNTGTGKMELVERHSRSYASVVSDGAGRFRAKETTARLVPRSEYDFEQANARLQMPKELSNAPKGTFYDKTSSFFDNISCESTGAKDGKVDRNERRWNIETFGVAAPPGGHHHHNHYHSRNRRGNYRGRDRPQNS